MDNKRNINFITNNNAIDLLNKPRGGEKMKKAKTGQQRWVMSQEAYEKLISKDDVLYLIDKEIDFSFAHDLTEGLYSDIGRPAKDVEMMLRAETIQTLHSWVDRELESQARYNIRVKWFLGLDLDEPGFDHSTVCVFRNRLGPKLHRKAMKIINAQLERKGFITEDERHILDATHTLANAAVISTTELFKRGVRKLYAIVKGISFALYTDLLEETGLCTEKELGRKTKKTQEYDVSDTEKKINLTSAVVLMQETIDALERLASGAFGQGTITEEEDRLLLDEVERRRKMIRDYVEIALEDPEDGVPEGEQEGAGLEHGPEGERGNDNEAEARGEDEAPPDTERPSEGVKVTERKKKGEGRQMSFTDEDARWGAKSRTKIFHGFKAHVDMTENGFITDIEGTSGNVSDDAPVIPMMKEQLKEKGRLAKEYHVDKKYPTGPNLAFFRENGSRLIGGLADTQKSSPYFRQDEFQYDEEREIVTCPAGHSVGKHTETVAPNGTKSNVFRFHWETCFDCPLSEKCTRSINGRTVAYSEHYKYVQELKAYQKTEDYKESKKIRPLIEGRNGYMKRVLGLDRAKYRGVPKYRTQCFLTAIASNLRRMVTCIEEASSVSCAKSPIISIS